MILKLFEKLAKIIVVHIELYGINRGIGKPKMRQKYLFSAKETHL